MVDRLTPERRSWLMSRVASKNTSPELRVRRAAHAVGLRFRLHRADLPGKPDLVFPKYRVALFVHGCFWHRHPNCRKSSTPKTRTTFWDNKFAANVARDRQVIKALRRIGWRVVVVWECQTKDAGLLAKAIARVTAYRPVTAVRTQSARKRGKGDSMSQRPRSGHPPSRSPIRELGHA